MRLLATVLEEPHLDDEHLILAAADDLPIQAGERSAGDPYRSAGFEATFGGHRTVGGNQPMHTAQVFMQLPL